MPGGKLWVHFGLFYRAVALERSPSEVLLKPRTRGRIRCQDGAARIYVSEGSAEKEFTPHDDRNGKPSILISENWRFN